MWLGGLRKLMRFTWLLLTFRSVWFTIVLVTLVLMGCKVAWVGLVVRVLMLVILLMMLPVTRLVRRLVVAAVSLMFFSVVRIRATIRRLFLSRFTWVLRLRLLPLLLRFVRLVKGLVLSWVLVFSLVVFVAVWVALE